MDTIAEAEEDDTADVGPARQRKRRGRLAKPEFEELDLLLPKKPPRLFDDVVHTSSDETQTPSCYDEDDSISPAATPRQLYHDVEEARGDHTPQSPRPPSPAQPGQSQLSPLSFPSTPPTKAQRQPSLELDSNLEVERQEASSPGERSPSLSPLCHQPGRPRKPPLFTFGKRGRLKPTASDVLFDGAFPNGKPLVVTTYLDAVQSPISRVLLHEPTSTDVEQASPQLSNSPVSVSVSATTHVPNEATPNAPRFQSDVSNLTVPAATSRATGALATSTPMKTGERKQRLAAQRSQGRLLPPALALINYATASSSADMQRKDSVGDVGTPELSSIGPPSFNGTSEFGMRPSSRFVISSEICAADSTGAGAEAEGAPAD